MTVAVVTPMVSLSLPGPGRICNIYEQPAMEEPYQVFDQDRINEFLDRLAAAALLEAISEAKSRSQKRSRRELADHAKSFILSEYCEFLCSGLGLDYQKLLQWIQENKKATQYEINLELDL
jgi:hypothetical protein